MMIQNTLLFIFLSQNHLLNRYEGKETKGMVLMTKKYDVAIVGGGIAGLTAAIYAAKAGKQTVVLEQQKQMGGRAITTKKQGVYFSLGGHALYRGEAYETFRQFGLRLEETSPVTNAHGIWKNQLHVIPTSLSSLIQTPLLSWKGKLELAKWLTKLKTMDTSSFNQMSVRDWIETHLDDSMLRHLFYSLLRTSSFVAAPDLAIAGPVLKQLQSAINKGVLYLDKGWGSLVEKLRAQASRLGVNLLTGQKVATIEHQDQQVTSIRLADGAIVEASNVIITTPPSTTHKLVPHAEKTTLDSWVKQAIPVTVACLDVGLRQLAEPKNQLIYGLDQPIFYSNQSRPGKPRAAIMSDDGTQLVILFKYLGPQTDAEQDKRELERVLDLTQPRWRDHIVAKQFLPKMTVVYDFPHMKRITNPGPSVPEIRGLYVAGDWASHGELLVDASVASAKRAVDHLISQSVVN